MSSDQSNSESEQNVYAAQGFLVGVVLGMAVLYHAAHASWSFEKTTIYYIPAFWTPIFVGMVAPTAINWVFANVE